VIAARRRRDEDADRGKRAGWSADSRSAENWSAESTPLAASGRFRKPILHAQRRPHRECGGPQIGRCAVLRSSAGPTDVDVRCAVRGRARAQWPAGAARRPSCSRAWRSCSAPGWAAISLGIIRVNSCRRRVEAKLTVQGAAHCHPQSRSRPGGAATADTDAPPPALSSIDGVPDIVADMTRHHSPQAGRSRRLRQVRQAI